MGDGLVSNQTICLQDVPTGQIGGSGGGKAPEGVFSLNVPFAKGSISVQVRVTGDAISPAYLARVRRYLELAEQEWDDAENVDQRCDAGRGERDDAENSVGWTSSGLWRGNAKV